LSDSPCKRVEVFLTTSLRYIERSYSTCYAIATIYHIRVKVLYEREIYTLSGDNSSETDSDSLVSVSTGTQESQSAGVINEGEGVNETQECRHNDCGRSLVMQILFLCNHRNKSYVHV
jgi:hypothetical protein